MFEWVVRLVSLDDVERRYRSTRRTSSGLAEERVVPADVDGFAGRDVLLDR